MQDIIVIRIGCSAQAVHRGFRNRGNVPWAHAKTCVMGSMSQGFRIPVKHNFQVARKPVSKTPVSKTPVYGTPDSVWDLVNLSSPEGAPGSIRPVDSPRGLVNVGLNT